jgi:hypothetical protein
MRNHTTNLNSMLQLRVPARSREGRERRVVGRIRATHGSDAGVSCCWLGLVRRQSLRRWQRRPRRLPQQGLLRRLERRPRLRIRARGKIKAHHARMHKSRVRRRRGGSDKVVCRQRAVVDYGRS